MQSRVHRPTKQPGPASQKDALNQEPASSNITTFVRCLHLLDLDQLEDWPAITENIFAAKSAQQNLQARIKAVEWSLYRLFEIYDPKETQTKLRPFFPPLAPLQSLNLRAALFRALTELKKNGILRRDAVLRKTMLDECKGEKFEEVISTFAMMVLRRACRSRHPELNLDQMDRIPKEQLVPLILAYRLSLQQSLQQRHSISQNARELSARLASEQIELQKRLEEVQQGFQPVNENDLTQLSNVVKSAWIGDDRWCNILLEGRTRVAPPIHQRSFESSWTGLENDDQIREIRSNDLAAELDEKIEEQEKRLRKWKTFYASMTNAQAAKVPRSKVANTLNKPPLLRFDQHKELRPNFSQLDRPVEERLELYHASVLKNMHTELAALTSFVPVANVFGSKQQNEPNPSSQAKAAESALDSTRLYDMEEALDDPGIASSAQQNVPTVVDIGYQSTPEIVHEVDTSLEAEEHESEALPGLNSTAIDSLLGVESAPRSEQSISIPSSPPVGPRVSIDAPQTLKVNEKYQDPTMDVLNSKRNSNATLQERTRASLMPFVARSSSPDPQPDSTADEGVEDDNSQVLPPLPETTGTRGTLLERTRQSMALLPNPPLKSKSSRTSSVKQPCFSELFPVNQFAIPGERQVQQSGAWPSQSGSSTPRDKLFSEEADYASVFKSRPRIAISPSLSPERSNLGLDSMLADGVDDLDLDPEDNDDTPSRGMIRNA